LFAGGVVGVIACAVVAGVVLVRGDAGAVERGVEGGVDDVGRGESGTVSSVCAGHRATIFEIERIGGGE